MTYKERDLLYLIADTVEWLISMHDSPTQFEAAFPLVKSRIREFQKLRNDIEEESDQKFDV